MALIDIILVVLLGFGLIRGFFKGFFVEVASLVALVAGIYGAIHFSYFVADLLIEHVDWSEKAINLTAFAITFVVIVLVIALAGKALTKLANFAALGFLNKLLGGVFGLLKIGLILSILLIIFEKMNSTIAFIDDEQTQDSILYTPVKSLAPMLFPTIIKAELTEDNTADSSEEIQ